MGIATHARNTEFFCLDQGRARSTERVAQQIAAAKAEPIDVLADEVRRIREHEAIPIVDWCVRLLDYVDARLVFHTPFLTQFMSRC